VDVRLASAVVMDRAGGSADAAPTQSASATDIAAARESELDYAGFSRFELELEVCVRLTCLSCRCWKAIPSINTNTRQFVQCLANPLYMQHLAILKLYDNPQFVEYLRYLRYFESPRYITYLRYPAPTLKALELLQEEQFRKDILSPEVVARLMEGGINASMGET